MQPTNYKTTDLTKLFNKVYLVKQLPPNISWNTYLKYDPAIKIKNKNSAPNKWNATTDEILNT